MENIGFSENSKFYHLCKLFKHLTENIKLRLGDICLIANPHSDLAFVHLDKTFDSWIVPIEELDKEDLC